METVQLQCGNCGKVMAIATEHLGGQVRCPHCLTVVQTPPRSAPPPSPTPPPVEIVPPNITPPNIEPNIGGGEVESIFSAEPPSEDIFDAGPQRPLVEMPTEVDLPLQPVLTAALHEPEPAVEPAAEESHAAGLPRLQQSRPIFDRGYGAFIALVFFVPYSIISTAIIAYLLYLLSRSGGAPLEDLPDPGPKGAQKITRVKHDQPLAEQQKVVLNGFARVGGWNGGLEVHPTKVVYTPDKELELHMTIENITTDQVINPMDPDFLKFPETKKNPPKPYTFLDAPISKLRVYKARLAFQRSDEEGLSLEAQLKPGEKATLVLTTQPPEKQVVENIVNSSENLTWRVQLRRGLVNNVSRTAVIGVEFNAKQIEKAS